MQSVIAVVLILGLLGVWFHVAEADSASASSDEITLSGDPAPGEPPRWLLVYVIALLRPGRGPVLDAGVPDPLLPTADAPVLPGVSAAHRLRLLTDALGQEQGRLLQFRMKLAEPSLEGRFAAQGTFILPPLDPSPLMAHHQTADDVPRRLDLRGSAGAVGYGLSHQSIGKRLERLGTDGMAKDREVTELWVDGRLGITRMKSSVLTQADNVDRDPRRPRTTTSQGGVALEVAYPKWPVITASYAHGWRQRSLVRVAARRQGAVIDVYKVSAYYRGGKTWDVSLSSTYQEDTSDTVHPEQSFMLGYDFNGTYQLTPSIMVVPALSLYDDRYQGRGDSFHAATGSLSISYMPSSSPLYATVTGSVDRTLATAGWTAAESVDARVSLGWKLPRQLLGDRSRISVEVGYSHYVDRLYPASYYLDVSATVLFRIASY